MDQFYVQCHFNRIPLHPVRVKKINEWLNFSTRLVVGIQVIVFTYFRAWSMTWSCGSKEKIVSLLPLTQLSVLSPPTMMESTITQKSSQLSQKCLTQALIHPNVWVFLPNRLICKHYCNFNVIFNNTKVEASVLDRRSYNHAFKVKLHSQHYSGTTVTTQGTFQSSPWWLVHYNWNRINWSTQSILSHHLSLLWWRNGK